jgi:ADP-ribosylglycohydrolase
LRALPVAALDRPPEDLRSLAAEVAAQTHGAPDGFLAAADIVLVAAACLEGDDVVSACRAGLAAARRADPASPRLAALAAAAAPDPQPQARRLAVLARDRTAPATATAALYVACSFPRPDQLADALRFAAQAPPQVAAITGALLGAVHGPDALPVDALSRCELVWVTDTLARDLVTELTESPAGQETLKPTGPGQYDLAWEQRSEPSWWSRYPGW